MSVKFVVAKHSSQMLRGVRELCEALNSNKKLHRVQFGTLRVHVIHEEFSALNFTSVNVAKLSSQTLREPNSSQATPTREAFNSNYISRCAVHTGLHYDLSNAPSASDVASPSPHFQWSQSCLTIWRTQNSSAARISSSKSSCHLPHHSKFDTQMTQILLEEYIFIQIAIQQDC